jgi:choline kinase
MKAIILAAGQGTRIRSAHGECPKCLIRFNRSNWTILDQQLDCLFEAGVNEVCIVVGYEKDQIVRHVNRNYRQRLRRIRFIENPAFAVTNNIYSLWLAREWVEGCAFVCLNADVVFDVQSLMPALLSTAPATMIVDPEWRDETMKVITRHGRVVRMDKKIAREEFSGTYIGITAFAAATHGPLFERIGRLIENGQSDVFFNVAVQQLADEGVHVAYTHTSKPWAEIDDPGDLRFARDQVFPLLAPAPAA